MFDPERVAGGALDLAAVRDGDRPEQGVDTYALHEDEMVPFDPAVAEWEGAMIPRRPIREPTGSAADWLASGTWRDGAWTVEMSRALATDHPADTTQLAPGSVFEWSPAIHHGAGKRWHWVGYPYRLGLGVDPTYPSEAHTEDATITVPRVAGPPDWGAVPTHTLPLVFPGIQTWTDLTSDDHPRAEAVRALETTIWDLQPPGTVGE
jgi:hypothetical protein